LAAPCDNSPISAGKSQDVEEQDAQLTENMASERNYEDQALRAPEVDNALDVEGSINEAKDIDHVICLCYNKVIRIAIYTKFLIILHVIYFTGSN